MLSLENIPVQTIAPRFSGRFNKGVDYVGDPDMFATEFESDLLIIDYAVKEFGRAISCFIPPNQSKGFLITVDDLMTATRKYKDDDRVE